MLVTVPGALPRKLPKPICLPTEDHLPLAHPFGSGTGGGPVLSRGWSMTFAVILSLNFPCLF